MFLRLQDRLSFNDILEILTNRGKAQQSRGTLGKMTVKGDWVMSIKVGTGFKGDTGNNSHLPYEGYKHFPISPTYNFANHIKTIFPSHEID